MIALWLALMGCGGPAATVVDTSAQPIGLAECAVCGMVVAEQPAPRGQAVHRDGTRAHLCSLGDLRAYVQVPNPRGAPLAIYVETLPADDLALTTAPHAWTPADAAHYVSAPDRGTIMGHPLLAFADRTLAESVAAATSQSVLTWTHLRETPFSQVP